MVEMTPSPRDASLPGDLERFDRRALIWLWSYLQLKYQVPLNSAMFDVSGAHQNEIRRAIDEISMPNLPKVLVSLYNQTALDESHFGWMKSSNERLIQWLLFVTENAWLNRPTRESSYHKGFVDHTLPPQLSLRDKIIARTDLWDEPLNEKEQLVAGMKKSWGAVQLDARHLLSWLERSNGRQHDWVLEYIQRKGGPRSAFGIPQLSNSYNTILSWFDCWPGHRAEKELFLRTMGQRWSQAKYKKKLRGKQHNFILTKETNNQLNKLKKTWGVSRNQVIERLIQAEFKVEEAQLSGPSAAESAKAASDAKRQYQELAHSRICRLTPPSQALQVISPPLHHGGSLLQVFRLVSVGGTYAVALLVGELAINGVGLEALFVEN